MLDAFSTYFRENPDYSYQDKLQEANFLWQRQKAIQDFLAGELDLDSLLGLFEIQGINPDQYVDEVNENLDFYRL